MANHKSAIKRSRQANERQERNKTVRTRVKNAVKALRQSTAEKPKEDALKQLQATQSIIDRASKKGVVHKRTASRKVSRLSRHINRMTG